MRSSLKKMINTSVEHHASVHGVLLDIYGVGSLIIGQSGVGKSECALDLISRGHRLVSDDLVLVKKDSSGHLFGSSPKTTRYFIEVRGLGLLNVFHLYGAASVRDVKKIDMVLELVALDDTSLIDRLGLEFMEYNILEKVLPMVRVPCWKGRNVTTIVEVAARNQILKWAGYDSAVDFDKKHSEELCS